MRRTYIPKAGNKELRPLGILAYEDKLVQGAMADVLNEIYENIFLDCSYGFRLNRISQFHTFSKIASLLGGGLYVYFTKIL